MQRQVLGRAVRTELAGLLVDDGVVVAAQPLRHPRRQRRDLRREPVDLGADRQRLRTVVEQPAPRSVDEPAQVQRHPVGHRDRIPRLHRRPGSDATPR